MKEEEQVDFQAWLEKHLDVNFVFVPISEYTIPNTDTVHPTELSIAEFKKAVAIAIANGF